MKKRNDLNDVIREGSSRGRKQPIDVNAHRKQEERRSEVLRVLRRGTGEDFRVLLEKWGYSKEEIDRLVRDYDALRGQQSS